VSSIYTSAPEPTADGSNQVDVARALKQTSEALIRKTEELEATIKELQSALNVTPPEDTASIITDSQPFPNGGNLTPASDIVDPILDRAIEQARAEVRQAQAETRTVLAAFQTALDNFKAGYDDTNAVVNATIYEISAQVGGNTARITEEELVRATSTQALAGRVGKITSVMNSNSAAITTEAVTRANADSALAAQITTVQTQTNNNTAAITAETIARTNADSALASQITSVEVKANSATANGSYGLIATAGTNGAVAEFAVQVRATGSGSYANAGMNVQVFSGGSSRIKFYANQFIVTTGPDQYQPFAISGGVVYANDLMVGNANIVNASITSAKIGNLEVKTANINDLAVTTAKINSLAVTSAKIGNLAVTSAKIDDLAVTTAKIQDLSVETLKIQDNAVTIPQGTFDAAPVYGTGVGNYLLTAEIYINVPADLPSAVSIHYTAMTAYPSGLRNTATVMNVDGVFVGGVPAGSAFAPSVAMVYQAVLSPGWHHIEVYWYGADGTVSANNRSLIVNGMKK